MILRTLIKKEIFELFKTKKFLILPLVFVFFSASSPLLAFFLNDMLKSVPGMEALNMPDPTFNTAVEQLLQNYNQLGYFVLLFVSTSLFIGDKTKGRLILLLSKPMKRKDILLSKYIVMVAQFIISIVLGMLIFIPYTYILFKEFNVLIFSSIILLYILYGIFLITLSLFTSTIFKSYMASILVTIVVFFTFGIFNLFGHKIFYLLPGQLSLLSAQVLTKTVETSNLLISIFSTLIIIILLLFMSIKIFRSQEVE